MKNTVNCYRCGKEEVIDFRNLEKVMECPHCHSLMAIDTKTQRLLKYTRYILVALVVGGLMYACMKLGEVQSYTALIFSVIIATIISLYSDKLCFVITWKVFGLNYVEYHSEKERNGNVKPKDKKKDKK